VVLLTNKDYPVMYNSAVVAAEAMKAIGIKAELKVVDWPTSIQMYLKTTTGWNFFFTGYGTQPALGPLAVMQFFVPPNAAYKPEDKLCDPDLAAAWKDMNEQPEAKDRQAAFARMQQLILDRAYAFPFGSRTKVQAVRANVEGFTPFRIPRMSNVWFEK
jgi:peptide/nickel transport system substrate-binding protein